MKNIEKFFGIGVVAILLISGMGLVSACDSDLVVGRKHVEVGNVETRVKFSTEQLIITYTTTGDWTIKKTHLAVATTLGGIPTNGGGNPKVGKFRLTVAGLPDEISDTEVIYRIDRDELGLDSSVGGTVFIAAHAVVYSLTYGEETAWGDTIGQQFPGAKSWALYFEFDVPAWT